MDTHDNTTQNNSFFYLSVMLGIVILLIGYYTYTQVSGNTLFGVTITTNPDLEDGLVGHYTFDGPDIDWSSTTAEILDRSGNGNGGDASNMDTNVVRAGVIGQALELNGTDQTVTIATPITNIPTTEVTASMWVRMQNHVNWYDIVNNNWGTASDTAPWLLFSTSAGQAIFGLWPRNGTYNGQVSAIGCESAFTLNEWHHMVGTYDGDDVKVYLNGVLCDTNSALSGLGMELYNGDIRLGENGSPGVESYLTDDIRIYNRALSAKEVQRLYELGATTHIGKTITTNDDLENNLVLHYTFDGADIDWSSTTAEVRDRSGSGIHGDTNITSSDVVSGKIGQAFSFDVSADRIDADDNSALHYTDYTLAFWIKQTAPLDNSDYELIFLNGDGGTTAGTGGRLPGVWYSNSGDGALHWRTTNAVSGNDGLNTPAGTVEEDTWVHITGAKIGTALTIYKNGVELDSVTLQSATLGTGYGGIQMRGDSGNGVIFLLDDVRLYDRGLSSVEAKRLYELGATTKVGTTLTTNPDLEDGLVGHYTFDGKDIDWSSTTAEILDRSGNDNRGDVTNFTHTSAISGNVGQALSFDGSDDYIDFQNDADLNPSAFTISAWIQVRELASSTNYNILAKQIWASKLGYRFFLGGYGGCVNMNCFAVGVGDGTNQTETSNTENITQLNRWYHLAATYDGGDIKQYVDGVLVYETTSAVTTISHTSNDMRIGGHSTGGEYFPGRIDDVRLYNRALSAAEVQRLYELGN